MIVVTAIRKKKAVSRGLRGSLPGEYCYAALLRWETIPAQDRHLPPMSATATAVGGSTTMRRSAAGRRMTTAAAARVPASTTIAWSRVSTAAITRRWGWTSATAVTAAIAGVRASTIGTATVRTLRNNRLPHVEGRTRRSTVSTAIGTVATTAR
jgi:hypothetical protein